MSQANLGTIDPQTTSGSTLASLLNAWQGALHTQHSGTSRPSYAVAGMVWLDTTSSDVIFKYFNGSVDIPLAQLDATRGTFRMCIDADGDSYIRPGTTDDEIEVVIAGTVAARFTSAGIFRGNGQAAGETSIVTKSANHTALVSDHGKTLEFDSARTLTLDPATLGAKWGCLVKATGGAVTLSPSSGTVDIAVVPQGVVFAIQSDGTNIRVIWFSRPLLLHVREEQAKGVNAGGASAGNNTRALNTIVTDEIGITSVVGGEVRGVPAGTYRVRASAPALRANQHQLRLETDGGDKLILGTAAYDNANSSTAQSVSTLFGTITLAAADDLYLIHEVTLTSASFGLGVAADLEATEVYSELVLERIA